MLAFLRVRAGSLADDPQKGERRSWRRVVREALSNKAQVLLHHWSDGCRCCGGVRAHVTGKSYFGCPSLSAVCTGPLEVRRSASCWRSRPAAAGHNRPITLGL